MPSINFEPPEFPACSNGSSSQAWPGTAEVLGLELLHDKPSPRRIGWQWASKSAEIKGISRIGCKSNSLLTHSMNPSWSRCISVCETPYISIPKCPLFCWVSTVYRWLKSKHLSTLSSHHVFCRGDGANCAAKSTTTCQPWVTTKWHECQKTNSWIKLKIRFSCSLSLHLVASKSRCQGIPVARTSPSPRISSTMR